MLASASPRRTELLRAIGVRHEVASPGDAEAPPGSLAPRDHVLAAARAKCDAVFANHPGRTVLAADTEVALSDDPADVLGKPADAAAAAAMLDRLSGRTHRVLTGVVLRSAAGVAAGVSETEVEVGVLSEELIARYVATGEPLDKAGAYAVQGAFATHVLALRGSWSNVVGLPLELLPLLFARAGLELSDYQDW